jgi:hypothetical protein
MFRRNISPPSSSAYSTLKMDAISSSETSVDFQRTTQRYIPEDSILHNQSYNDTNYTPLISLRESKIRLYTVWREKLRAKTQNSSVDLVCQLGARTLSRTYCKCTSPSVSCWIQKPQTYSTFTVCYAEVFVLAYCLWIPVECSFQFSLIARGNFTFLFLWWNTVAETISPWIRFRHVSTRSIHIDAIRLHEVQCTRLF